MPDERTKLRDPTSPGGEGETASEVVGLDAATTRDRDRMRLAILLVLGAGAAYAIVKLLAPFTLGIVTASVAAVLSYGSYARLRDALGGRRAIAAGLVTAAAFLLVVVPTAGLLVVLANGIQSGVSVVTDRFQDFADQRGELWNLLESVASVFGIGAQELGSRVQDQLDQLGSVLAGETVGLISGLGSWAAQAGIGIFTLFYLLRDGESFLDILRWTIPLDRDLTDALFAKTTEVVTATVLGGLLVAAAQGLAGGIVYWILDIPGPVLWGATMAFLGLLPVVGPPVVWIPTSLLLMSSGRVTDGLILAAAGTFIVGTIDNVLRAILVGGRAQLHPLVVFFSVLGGVVVFGTAGFLFGPVLAVVAFSMIEIARVALYGGDDDPLAGTDTILARVTTESDEDRVVSASAG